MYVITCINMFLRVVKTSTTIRIKNPGYDSKFWSVSRVETTVFRDPFER